MEGQGSALVRETEIPHAARQPSPCTPESVQRNWEAARHRGKACMPEGESLRDATTAPGHNRQVNKETDHQRSVQQKQNILTDA